LQENAAVSEAITVLLSAAERAAANGRFAAEVVCLQTATQFGDHSSAPRLGELESIVEGPRVGLAAPFAVALRDGDAAELTMVSEDSSAWATSLRPSMRPPTPPWCIAAKTYGDRGQATQRARCFCRPNDSKHRLALVVEFLKNDEFRMVDFPDLLRERNLQREHRWSEVVAPTGRDDPSLARLAEQRIGAGTLVGEMVVVDPFLRDELELVDNTRHI
jgi:hypothetical protein